MGWNQNITGPYGHDWPREDVLAGVGKGWHPLVSELIDDLFKVGWDGSLHQIKEKFGGLRFYIGGGSKEIHDRITKAENESYKTCEVCGDPGKQSGGGWIRTLCERHLAIDREGQFVQDEESREDQLKLWGDVNPVLSGFAETAAPDHNHECYECGDEWGCNDETCEVCEYRCVTRRNCPMCELG